LAAVLDDRLFKALGDETRLHILVCLSACREPQSVKEIAACCSVDMSVVSRHLKRLQDAGVLEVRRDGKFVRYGIRHADLAERLRSLAGAIECCAREAAGRCEFR
jgi:ArsR family transcriptional regulator